MEGAGSCYRKFRLQNNSRNVVSGKHKCDKVKVQAGFETNLRDDERTDSKQTQLLITRPHQIVPKLGCVWVAGGVIGGADEMADVTGGKQRWRERLL